MNLDTNRKTFGRGVSDLLDKLKEIKE